MEIPYKKIFQFLYGPFFAVLDFFMRNYKANRERLNRLITGKGISSFLQNAAIALLVIWIIIFIFASEDSRKRLTEAVNEGFQEIKTIEKK